MSREGHEGGEDVRYETMKIRITGLVISSRINPNRREKSRLVTTNGVEGFFSLLKRGVIGTFHHVSEQHLPLYLAEFDHRHNFRNVTDGERTVEALKKAND
jgi:hypothetical protein